MMKIRCIAVDDEPLALEKIKGYISRIDYLELLGSFSSAVEAINFIRKHRVDLIFLDIQMDELSGIQMLEALGTHPKVIITTAYESYAIKGYELDVTDYLLKPISFQRFLKAAEKVFASLSEEDLSVKQPLVKKEQDNPEYCLFIKSGNRLLKIAYDDILFIQGMKDYLRIWTNKEKIMTLMSFKRIEEILPSGKFLRIHKSYIVSVNNIESIEKNRVLIGGERLPVGESYKLQFFQFIEKRKIG